MYTWLINPVNLKIAVVVLSYWVISISMIFANKYLVGDRNDEKDITIFIAWCQCFVTVALITSYNYFKKTFMPKHESDDNDFGSIPLFKDLYQIKWLTLSYIGLLYFNNLCLKNVGVAFFQVARSLTLIFVVILSYLILKKSISIKVCISCLLVISGFVLGIDQEKFVGSLSTIGVFYGFCSSLSVAANGICLKKCLPFVNHSASKLTYYNNLNATILLFPLLLLSGQISVVIQSNRYGDFFFVFSLICTGGLGFLIAWISAIQVDLTSPVTHHISANMKSVIQTSIALFLSQQHKPLLWWMSNFMIVCGAFLYAYFRIKEEAQLKEILKEDIEAQHSKS